MSAESEVEGTPRPPPPPVVTPLKNFLAGGFGGMCLVIAGHPFDTIKVRLQTASKISASTIAGGTGTTGAGAAYSGAFDCFRRTFVHEGILGFYKGMGTPLIMVTPLFALGFFGYGVGKNVVSYLSPKEEEERRKREGGMLSPTQLFCAGAISACFTNLVICPVERIKCLLQIQLQNAKSITASNNVIAKYRGPWHCGTTLLREGGVSSLYRGFGATFIRGIPQAGLYYMTYDVLKMKMGGGGGLSPGKTMLAGGLTGIINWAIVLPLDVVKSRVQTAPEGMYPRGFRDAWPALLKTEGPRGLYRGIVPVFIRAFPANAACFFGFETAMKFLNYIGI